MMRTFLLVILAALCVSSLAFADGRCLAGFEYKEGKKEVSISVPVKLIRKIVEKVPVVGQVVGPIVELFKVEITFLQTWRVSAAECECYPCCEQPNFQYLSVNIKGSTDNITWDDTLEAQQPGEPPPVNPNITCIIWTESREYVANETKVEVTMDFPVNFNTKQTHMSIDITVHCKCTDNPECENNRIPIVRLPFPERIELDYGGEAEFLVWAEDKGPRPNLVRFSEQVKAAGCLTPQLVEQRIDNDQYGVAWYRVSYTGEEEILKSCGYVSAEDKCGSLGDERIDVFIFYPPVITVQEEK